MPANTLRDISGKHNEIRNAVAFILKIIITNTFMRW